MCKKQFMKFSYWAKEWSPSTKSKFKKKSSEFTSRLSDVVLSQDGSFVFCRHGSELVTSMVLTVVNNQPLCAIKFAPYRILSSPVGESVTGMASALDGMIIVIDNRAALVVELESETGMVMMLVKLKKQDSHQQCHCVRLTFASLSSSELTIQSRFTLSSDD